MKLSKGTVKEAICKTCQVAKRSDFKFRQQFSNHCRDCEESTTMSAGGGKRSSRSNSPITAEETKRVKFQRSYGELEAEYEAKIQEKVEATIDEILEQLSTDCMLEQARVSIEDVVQKLRPLNQSARLLHPFQYFPMMEGDQVFTNY